MTRSAPLVLLLWGTGDLAAITGSLCYAELAAIWPDVGGEYVYLKNIYGFLPAFLTGWISLVVGFSAPVATSSLLVIQYVSRFLHSVRNDPFPAMLDLAWVQKTLAAGLIIFFWTIHMPGVKRGSSLQNLLTVIKILQVVFLIAFGFIMADWSMTHRLLPGMHRKPEPNRSLSRKRGWPS